MLTRRHLIGIAASVVFAVSVLAQEKSIIVASTISTRDSGLFDHILPLFKAKTGIDVRVVAQRTGQALDTGRRGNAAHSAPLRGTTSEASPRRGAHRRAATGPSLSSG